MGASSNFGNMFSVVGASLTPPFLATAIQVLFQLIFASGAGPIRRRSRPDGSSSRFSPGRGYPHHPHRQASVHRKSRRPQLIATAIIICTFGFTLPFTWLSAHRSASSPPPLYWHAVIAIIARYSVLTHASRNGSCTVLQ
jgi:hypothetical protein